MAKKPRYIPQPGSLVEVSNRAVGSRFLLKPSREARELMAGVLARAARKYLVRSRTLFDQSSKNVLCLIGDAARCSREGLGS